MRAARLLLAEDNAINREVALELLQAVGFSVDLAEDGRQALLRAQTCAYDLVLMDMQMPHLDGLDATQAMRAMPEYRDTPIIAMTANAFGEDRRACEAAGMNDFVAKPVDPANLYATLLKWLPRVSATAVADELCRCATGDSPMSRLRAKSSSSLHCPGWMWNAACARYAASAPVLYPCCISCSMDTTMTLTACARVWPMASAR